MFFNFSPIGSTSLLSRVFWFKLDVGIHGVCSFLILFQDIISFCPHFVLFNRHRSKPNFNDFAVFLEEFLQVFAGNRQRNVSNENCAFQIFRFLFFGLRGKMHRLLSFRIFSQILKLLGLFLLKEASQSVRFFFLFAPLFEQAGKRGHLQSCKC